MSTNRTHFVWSHDERIQKQSNMSAISVKVIKCIKIHVLFIYSYVETIFMKFQMTKRLYIVL